MISAARQAVGAAADLGEGDETDDGPDDSRGNVPARYRGAHGGGKQLVDVGPRTRGEGGCREHGQLVTDEQRRMRPAVGEHRAQGHGHHGAGTGWTAADAISEPSAEEQTGQPEDAGGYDHEGGAAVGDLEDVLGVDEDQAVGGPGDHRHGEGQGGHDEESASEWFGHGAQDGHGVIDRGGGHGETVGLDKQSPNGEDGHQGDHGEGKDAAKTDGLAEPSVDDGRQPRAHAVPRRDQGDGLGPVMRAGLLGGGHGSHRVGGAEQWPPEGKDHDEPPVAGTARRDDGEDQPGHAAPQQHGAPAEAVRQPGQGQTTQGSQTQYAEADAELGGGETGLVDEGLAWGLVPEGLGHVAERGHYAELPEPGGQRHEGQSHHGGVAPRTKVQRFLRRRCRRICHHSASRKAGCNDRRPRQNGASRATMSTSATAAALAMYHGHGPSTRNSVQFDGGLRKNM